MYVFPLGLHKCCDCDGHPPPLTPNTRTGRGYGPPFVKSANDIRIQYFFKKLQRLNWVIV